MRWVSEFISPSNPYLYHLFLHQCFINAQTASLPLHPQSVKVYGIVEMEAMRIKFTQNARVGVDTEMNNFQQ